MRSCNLKKIASLMADPIINVTAYVNTSSKCTCVRQYIVVFFILRWVMFRTGCIVFYGVVYLEGYGCVYCACTLSCRLGQSVR